MARALPLPPPAGFDDLTIEEKIEYVGSLWDRIAVEPTEIPVPDWHRRIVEERLARDEAHPEESVPWEDVKKEVLGLLHDRPVNR
jgi:putative addiction module component (TIGR02574 family)